MKIEKKRIRKTKYRHDSMGKREGGWGTFYPPKPPPSGGGPLGSSVDEPP